MAARYVCDRCGDEEPDRAGVQVIGQTAQEGLSWDLCAGCIDAFRKWVEVGVDGTG